MQGLEAGALAKAHAAHATAVQDPTGSARAFVGEAALPAAQPLNRAGVLTLLPAMHWVLNAVRARLVDPEAALYGNWMESRTSNKLGRPLSMKDAPRLTSEGSATFPHSSASALQHALRTRLSMEAAPYLNQAWARYHREMCELYAALHLLHPVEEDLEVEEVVISVESPGETPSRPPPGQPSVPLNGVNPPVHCCVRLAPPGAHLVSRSPAGHLRLAAWPAQTCPPPLSRTRGAHHRGQVLWQERPGTPLLLPVLATRGDAERVLGKTPSHLYGAAPVPRPPLRVPEARDGVHTFLWTQNWSAPSRGSTVCGSFRQPPTTPEGQGP